MNDLERVGKRLVRTIFDPTPTCDSTATIWCLGQQYDPKRPSPLRKPSTAAEGDAAHTPCTQPTPTSPADRPAAAAAAAEDDSWIRPSFEETDRKEAANGQDPAQYGNWPAPFLDDFESRIWMTYRSSFPPIPKSQDPKATAAMSWRVKMQNLANNAFTSDSGFGCMIRSGQCILANTLLTLRLGRDWRITDATPTNSDKPILSLFADDPRAPFSIHRFVEHGAAVCGKYPGEWFGPSAAARCIQDLVHEYKESGLRVYVSGDNADVYEDNLKEVAVDADGVFQPTLILVGTRLGIDKITPVYWEALKSSLQMRQSVGIAGGRPSASHYFVGNQANTFFYLDPHNTRPYLPHHADPALLTPDDVSTCHTRRLRSLEIREMDPSMVIAFLVRDEADFDEWKEAVVSVQGKPIVHISKSQPPPQGSEREGAIDEVESCEDDTEGETS